ncbi:DUF4262 domain-containing protein [Deinococcus aquatilis]|uniref:DUF4262 domain-containing protein n=1 Tax=Deinococcus aquatilis TaxID=519440 RepID=UPI0003643309|nr:DUF4262 domain-containing protein [Deinococcus aquatilis]
MTFSPPSPQDDFDRTLLHHVQNHGWFVVKVPDDEAGPGFAFTVGLSLNYQHPEVILIGLDLELMHRVLNAIGEDVKAGQQHYESGLRFSNLLEGYDCAFVSVATAQHREYLGTLVWFYSNQPFSAVQCVWPDKLGQYPWDSAAHPQFRSRQPILDGR